MTANCKFLKCHLKVKSAEQQLILDAALSERVYCPMGSRKVDDRSKAGCQGVQIKRGGRVALLRQVSFRPRRRILERGGSAQVESG